MSGGRRPKSKPPSARFLESAPRKASVCDFDYAALRSITWKEFPLRPMLNQPLTAIERSAAQSKPLDRAEHAVRSRNHAPERFRNQRVKVADRRPSCYVRCVGKLCSAKRGRVWREWTAAPTGATARGWNASLNTASPRPRAPRAKPPQLEPRPQGRVDFDSGLHPTTPVITQ